MDKQESPNSEGLNPVVNCCIVDLFQHSNKSLGSIKIFWGDGKGFEIQSTMLVFGEMAIWGDGNLG